MSCSLLAIFLFTPSPPLKSQEERLRVEDNVSNAASLELEAQAAASVSIKSEGKSLSYVLSLLINHNI